MSELPDAVGPGGPAANAVITWLDEPLAGAPVGPLAGRTLLVKDLDRHRRACRTTYGSASTAITSPTGTATRRAARSRRGCDGRRQGEPARSSRGACSGRTSGTGPCETRPVPGSTTGGSSAGNAAAIAAGLCDLGIGTDTGCSIRLPAAACDIVGLKSRSGPSRPTASSRSARRSTRSARWGGRSRTSRSLWSVLSGTAGARAAPRTGSPSVSCGRRLRSVTGARPSAATRPSRGSDDLERLGARVVEAVDPGGASGHVAASSCTRRPASHAETFPARADEYGDRRSARSSRPPRGSRPRRSPRATRRSLVWRLLEPETSTSS